MPHITEILALLVVLGLAAQWLGWRLRLPALVLLILFGLLTGPVLGIVRPSEALGDAFQPLVRLAVAVILFEGGLTLRWNELRQAGGGVMRLITLTLLLSWLLGAGAAYWIAGLSWPVAVVLGAIMVITGPTVILPLLRQARLRRRPAAYLKWEGIANDPAGAVLSVVAFEYFVGAGRSSVSESLIHLLLGLAAAGVVGIGAGWLLGRAFQAGKVPEYLKGPLALAAALGVYALVNLVLDEAGLMAATLMGLVLGNMGLPGIEEIRRFKAYATVLLVSTLFVLLTADLDPAVMLRLDWRSAAFLAAMIFLVRPLAVGLATLGAGMRWQELLLVAWIAPRGVVVAAVAGVFGPALAAEGYAGGDRLLPLAFALILSTVILHGLSIEWLGRRLGLGAPSRGGLLIARASPWSNALASALHEQGVPVLVADVSWHRLRPLRERGVPVYNGELVSVHAAAALELGEIETLLAAGDNDAYNALVCAHYAPDLGRQSVFQLATAEASERMRPAPEARGRTAFSDDVRFEDLERRWYQGARYRTVRITEEYGLDAFRSSLPSDALPMAVIDEQNRVRLLEAGETLRAAPGSRVLWYGCEKECVARAGEGKGGELGLAP
jgi:NhaP-type Na+/H+ or K+/H+ antiporter